MNPDKLLKVIKERWTTFEGSDIIIEGEAGYMNMRFIAKLEGGELVKITELTERKGSQRPFEMSTPKVIWEK